MDESATEYTAQELRWSYWMSVPTNPEDSAKITILHENEANQKPLSFFALDGKKTDRGFLVENSKVFFVLEAAGPRATQLAEAATRLNDTPNASRETIENLYRPGDGGANFQDVQGRHTFCQILKSMTQKTYIPKCG